MASIVDSTTMSDNHVDDHVDVEIQQCLNAVPPKSFFMFAGAGAGKTRSLILALEYIDCVKGSFLAEHGKQVAVITYTNAACDEINRRLQYKSIFHISTIHSFLWDLIKNFQADIKVWVQRNLEAEIAELQFKQSKGKGSEAARKRAEKIASKEKRLERVKCIQRFFYNPNGDNLGFDSLSHDEVVKIGTSFIISEPTMQQILVAKYPFFLIDESQDTKKELVDAILCVYERYKDCWAIGMFGDTMQRIYADGKDRLDEIVPKEWAFPEKVMNHRSSKRIVRLANEIRRTVDNKEQRPRTDARDGTIRLFIANPSVDKEKTEEKIAAQMFELTSDSEWKTASGYKRLILEHHMAASRFSFSNLYAPLDESGEFSTALRKGEIAEISFLANTIAPLLCAYHEDDFFGITKILRKSSPLLNKKLFEKQPEKQQKLLEELEDSVESLFSLWDNGKVPSCLDVLRNVRMSGLYDLGERVDDLICDSYLGDDPKVVALRAALKVPFDELLRYTDYVSDRTQFATHQGVKGLEFPRVMVILDDSESRGFLFSYEKLFGAKELTPTDVKNEKDGKDTSVRRTARLFYVACTRAIESLAVVAYSENPEMVKSTASSNGWFLPEEIVVID